MLRSCPWIVGSFAIGIGFLSAGGCGGRAAEVASPLRTLARYREALERDDPRAAYELLAEPLRHSLPFDEFAQQWKETGAERAAQLSALRAVRLSGRPAGLSQRAVVTLSQGSQLVLEPAPGTGSGRSPSDWRVLDPDLTRVRAETPEAALRLLLTAIDQRSLPAMLRLLSPAERLLIESELRERAERLRAALEKGLFAPGPVAPQAASAASAPAAPASGLRAGAGAVMAEPPSQVSTTPRVVRDARGDRLRVQYDPRFFIELERVPGVHRLDAGAPASRPRAADKGSAPSPSPAASTVLGESWLIVDFN